MVFQTSAMGALREILFKLAKEQVIEKDQGPWWLEISKECNFAS